MKSISVRAFGGPEVLTTIETERPSPRPRQVLIQMSATSLNAADRKIRSGAVPGIGDPPLPMGFDVAGTIVEIGSEVTGFAPGDEVFGMVSSRTGTYSEYVLAQADALAPRPEGVGHLAAAALPTAALTAWQALDLAGLRAGERILVHAAAGGVGHLAVQLAAHRGAHVIGTARAANHDFLSSLGAHEVIDYTAVDFASAVDPVDVVLDLVGGDYAPRSLLILHPNGRYVSAQGAPTPQDPRCHSVVGRPSREDLTTIGKLCGSGQVTVHVDRVMSLAEVADAHRLGESGGIRGKLVLTPW